MSKVETYQIAIDGPSGVGKSSIAKNIAEKLNFVYINTGAMYRCYALALKNNNIDIDNINLVMQTLNQNKVELKGLKLRADRRWKQYNKSEPYEVVLQKIKHRDYQDTHRQFSPLIKVPDAFVINDKGSTIDEISDIIIKKFKEITNE